MYTDSLFDFEDTILGKQYARSMLFSFYFLDAISFVTSLMSAFLFELFEKLYIDALILRHLPRHCVAHHSYAESFGRVRCFYCFCFGNQSVRLAHLVAARIGAERVMHAHDVTSKQFRRSERLLTLALAFFLLRERKSGQTILPPDNKSSLRCDASSIMTGENVRFDYVVRRKREKAFLLG